MGELITEPKRFIFNLDELYVLDAALRDYRMRISEPASSAGWRKEQRERAEHLHDRVAEEIKRQEKPEREEQILRQARDILRERGIKSWSL